MPASADKAATARELESALKWLKSHATKAARDGMARFAIPSDKAFGVTMSQLKVLAKQVGRNHDLAEALWKSGWYEARMLASLVGEPDRVTPAQMERWCKELDNWAIADTVCFALFDRTPHAWTMAHRWSRRKAEFEKRAGFALYWSLSVHAKGEGDARFLEALAAIEREAGDERHFVKKAVNMALRAIGKRNATLHAESIKVAKRLSVSALPAAQWVGKDALRELNGASVARRLAAKASR